MDLKPLALVKEGNTVAKNEPRDACESAAADKTECEARRQSLQPAAPSSEQGMNQDKLLRLEQEDPDESDSEPEEMDAMAFVAVKLEPNEDSPNSKPDVDRSKRDVTEPDDCAGSSSPSSDDDDLEPLNMVMTEMKPARKHERKNTRGELSAEIGRLEAINTTVTLSSSTSTKPLPAVQPFSCLACPYKCRKSSSLKTHLLIHTGEHPFQCSECSYKCRTSSCLKRHMYKHTGAQPYRCKRCSYACSQSGDLKKHVLIHTGEHPFLCKYCSYKCRSSGSLNRHLLIHSGEQPFHCTACAYKCNQSGSLKKHMMIHSGEMPFQCSECAYKCRTSNALKMHMLVHARVECND